MREGDQSGHGFLKRFAHARQSSALFLAIACLFVGIAPPLLVKSLPGTADLENLVHDLYRTALAPEVGIDPDISIIHYDDVTARDTGKTSPVDRALLAKAIRAADAGGAKAIGVDFFFAQPTDDEDDLVAAINAARAPVFMIYADPEADRGAFWSAEISVESKAHQDDLWGRIARADVTKASPMIGTDSANTARRWPTHRATSQVSLAGAMAGIEPGFEGSIAYSKLATKRPGTNDSYAGGMFPSFSLTSFREPAAAQAIAPFFADRYVLIGLDIFNADRFPTPITRVLGENEIPGVTVHAHMLRQALDQNFPAPLPVWGIAMIGLAMAAAGAAAGMLDKKGLLFAAAILIVFAFLAAVPLLAVPIDIDMLSIPMTGWLISVVLMLALSSYLNAARTSRERAFARGALGKYLAADVAQEILDDPDKLSLEGEERSLFMLFTDLEGFTRISHTQPPRATARILNRYLDEMSDVILDHGGTIDKFVGDAIVAFWGAPLASESDGPNSVACALALHNCAERLRGELNDRGEALGRTRIGLHYGPVVVGNFGGKQRIQYTALGDAMNTAARLEGANKYLGSDILVSAAVREAAPGFAYRPLGQIVMAGVDDPIAVYEPVAGDKANYAVQVEAAMAAVNAGEPDGVTDLRGLHENFPDDRALSGLIERLDAIKGGKPYVLGSK